MPAIPRQPRVTAIACAGKSPPRGGREFRNADATMTQTPVENAAPGGPIRAAGTEASTRALVLLLAFAWGPMWIATAIALREVSPWSLRFASASIGSATLFAAAQLSGHDLRLPRGERRHVFVAGFFNVAAFNMFAVFAQLSGATSRVIIITYSMPIWAALLSRFMLGERLDKIRAVALALCVAGLATLLWPQLEHGVPRSLLLSLGCAFSWGFATVYIKWAKLTVEPITNAAWQLLYGALLLTIGMLVFEHYPRLGSLSAVSWIAVVYMGLLGVGLAHFLWWSIVGKLPAVTASIGALLVPVIGVACSALVLGERLTVSDMIGFALIFAAAACVLLQPGFRRAAPAE
jgi:drug/metabolite transporter (DMT)-like permease